MLRVVVRAQEQLISPSHAIPTRVFVPIIRTSSLGTAIKLIYVAPYNRTCLVKAENHWHVYAGDPSHSKMH